MTKNTTAPDEMSRPDVDQETRDAIDKRLASMNKVCERLAEGTARLDQISAVAGAVLPDLIAYNPLGQATDTIAKYDKTITELEKAVAGLKARLAYAKEVSMPNRMDAEECSTFNTDDTRVTRLSKVYASITGDKEEAFGWLREQGFEGLIQEVVNASSLSSAAKQLMEDGRELPEEMFKVHVKDSISITRKGKK